MRLHSLEVKANEYKGLVEGNANGVNFWRLELESLQRQLHKLYEHRRRMRANVNSQNAYGRDQWLAKTINSRLNLLCDCWIERDRSGVLKLMTPLENALHSPEDLVRTVSIYPNHPNSRRFSAYSRAHDLVQQAVFHHRIPMPIINMKIKRNTRWSVEYDLLGYAFDDRPLVVARVGYPTSDKPTAQFKYRFFVLNDTTARDFTYRKDDIRQVIRKDPAPDSLIKHFFGA